MENFHYLMGDLLDEPNLQGSQVCFTEKSIRLLHKITALLKNENAAVSMREVESLYPEKMSAEEIFLDMRKLLAKAPSAIHMIVYAEAIIPIIDARL